MAMRKRKPEPKKKKRLQADIQPENFPILQWAAIRRGEPIGKVIDWMIDTMRKQLEAA